MTRDYTTMSYETFSNLIDEALAADNPYEATEAVVQAACATERGRAMAYRLAYRRHFTGAVNGVPDDVVRFRNFFRMVGDERMLDRFKTVAEKVEVDEVAVEDTLAALGLDGATVGPTFRVRTVFDAFR